MTTHDLANLFDTFRTGLQAALKKDALDDFSEASAAFRALPEQPLRQFLKDIRPRTPAPTTGGTTAKNVAVSVQDVVNRINAVRDGSDTADGLSADLGGLKNNQLKEVLVAFGQKGTSTLAGNRERVNLLLTPTAPSPAPVGGSPSPAPDPQAVEEGVRLFNELWNATGTSIPDLRAGFEPLKTYPKSVVEEISRRVGYTPSGSKEDVLRRLLSNLEAYNMGQYRAELILTGTGS